MACLLKITGRMSRSEFQAEPRAADGDLVAAAQAVRTLQPHSAEQRASRGAEILEIDQPAAHEDARVERLDAERFDGGYCAEICHELNRMTAEAEAEGRGSGYVKVPGFVPVGAEDRSYDSFELARMTAFPDDSHSELREGFREWVDGHFTPYRMMLMVLRQEEPAEFMLKLYIDHLAETGDEKALFRQFGVRMIMVDTVKEE